MNLRAYFGGARGFWLAVGAGLVVALILLFGWALPAHRASVLARRTDLEPAYAELGVLERSRDEIPSDGALRDRQLFREWHEDEAKIVDRFFMDRAALLNVPLTGQLDPAPTRFKDEYTQRLARKAAWFRRIQNEMTVANPDGAFKSYEWVDSGKLPNPQEYPAVRRDFWSRDYLYRRFHEAGVAAVAALGIGDAAPAAETKKYAGLEFTAELDIAPDRLPLLLSKMLQVSPSAESPVFDIERLEVSGRPETAGPHPRCHVSMTGRILVLR